MDTKTDKRLAFGLLLGLALKYLLYGFQYFPVLDDYIQYGCYPLYPNVAGDVFLRIGTIATRPLASLLDPLFWGQMWGHMGLALALLTLLHFACYLVLNKTLRHCGYTTSALLPVLFLLCPLGSEATYWVSAASRILPGLLLALASAYFLARYASRRQWGFLLLSSLALLLCAGFYEQTFVFGLCAFGLVLWNKRKEVNWIALLLVPILTLAAFLFYYRFASGIGAMGSRASGFSLGAAFSNIPAFFVQLYELFGESLGKMLVLGTYNGFGIVVDRGLLIAIAFILLAALAAVCISRRTELMQRRPMWPLCVAGGILFLAPFAPNLLVEGVWLTNRSVLPSLIGLGLLLEPLFALLNRHPVVQKACLVFLVLVFAFSNANEYAVYRQNALYDRQVVENLSLYLDEDVLAGDKQVVIFREGDYHVPQPAYYKDHVKSVTGADWSLTGALRARYRNLDIQNILLLTDDADIDPASLVDKQVFYLEESGIVTEVIYDGKSFIPVKEGSQSDA